MIALTKSNSECEFLNRVLVNSRQFFLYISLHVICIVVFVCM